MESGFIHRLLEKSLPEGQTEDVPELLLGLLQAHCLRVPPFKLTPAGASCWYAYVRLPWCLLIERSCCRSYPQHCCRNNPQWSQYRT